MDKTELQVLQELASSGNTEAIYELVEYYLSVLDYDNAFLTAKRFEYFTSGKGYQMLGSIYLKGIGTNPDINKAKECFIKGFNLNDYDCGFAVASILIKEKNYSEAFPYLVSGVNSNHLSSIKLLGSLYLNGEGVMVNKDIAINLFSKAYELGDKKVSDTLGRIYYQLGDYSECFKYFTIGANNKNVNSIYHLGLSYAKGLGVKQDFNLARQYYQMGANYNEPRCLYNLSLYYREGIAVDRNISMADKLLQQAEKYGFKK